MNVTRAFPAIALGVVALFSASATATTCYAVIDRTDAVTYQSQRPPIDMSDPGAAGAAARDALRKRGEQMLVFESERCVERVAVASQSKSYATVDEIVMGYRSSASRPAGGVFGVAGDGGSGGANYGGGYADSRATGDWRAGGSAGNVGGYRGAGRAEGLLDGERAGDGGGRAAGILDGERGGGGGRAAGRR